MNKLIFYSILFLIVSCKQFQARSQKVNMDCDKIKYEIQVNAEADKKEESIEIYFTVNFENDSISIFNENEVLFNEIINTDHTTGTAKYVKIAKSNNLQLSINNCGSINLNDLKNYNYLYVEFQNGEKCIITKTGKEKFFK